MIDTDEDTIDLTKVIEELEDIDYHTLAEKAQKGFSAWYTNFFSKFGRDESGAALSDDVKKDMAVATYTMSLEALNTGLNYIEYAYLLSLSIAEANKTYNLEYSENVSSAMKITADYTEEVASNINLSLNDKMLDLLNDLKNKGMV